MNRRNRKNRGTLRAAISLICSQITAFVGIRLAATLLMITVASALAALGPVALKLLVDDFSSHKIASHPSVVTLVILYVTSLWLGRTVGQLRGFIYARADRRIVRTLSERLFAHVMRLPLSFHLERQTGAITQTLNNGIQGYQMVLQTIMFSIVPVFAQLGTIISVLVRLRQSAFLAIFSFGATLYTAVYFYAATTIRDKAGAASTAQVISVACMTDAILNYEAVKLFTAEPVVQERVDRELVTTERAWVRFFGQSTINGVCVAAVFAIFLGTALFYGAMEVQKSRMSVGTFVLVNAYLLQVIRPVEAMGNAMQSLSMGLAYLEALVAVLKEGPESPCGASRVSSLDDAGTKGRPARVAVDNVSFAYRPGLKVISALNLDLPAGKTLGVVGPSGSGKSTLMRLLLRLIEPQSGRILLDGIPICELPIAVLRNAISVVPQDTTLFNNTIAYNIGFGRAGSCRKDVELAARRACLHDFIMTLPAGYETLVGERGVQLSAGERQRVSIARAVVRRPRLYIFDEATSSLDGRTEAEISANLREVSSESTTLVIAHRLSAVAQADEIVLLDCGAVRERGTHETLLRAGGQYAALWQAQNASRVGKQESAIALG